MTGYTVHTGATQKFASGWDRVFGKPAKKKADKPSPKGAKKAVAKKSRGK